MNRTALFAVIASGFLLSSFHHPSGSATFASQAPEAPRSISSEPITAKAVEKSEAKKINTEDPAAILN